MTAGLQFYVQSNACYSKNILRTILMTCALDKFGMYTRIIALSLLYIHEDI